MISVDVPMTPEDGKDTKRPYKANNRKNDDRGYRGKGGRPQGRPFRKDGGNDDRKSDGRPERRPYGDQRTDDRRSDRRPNRERGSDDRGKGRRRDDGRREQRDRPPRREGRRDERPRKEKIEEAKPAEKPRLILSNDPQRLLFKGVDMQANGNTDTALMMFIRGSVLMSKGCENNAVRLLENVDREDVPALRESISEYCTDDDLVEFDYLCWKAHPVHEMSFLEERFKEGNIQAVYRMVCAGKIDPEDPAIDVFSKCPDDPRAKEALKILSKKYDSKKAAVILKSNEDREKRRQSAYVSFNRAMKGDNRALKDLEKLSSEFREAAFFYGYAKARESGNGVQWLKDNYDEYSDIMISEGHNLRIDDDPFGMFLRAKKIQSKKEDWIPSMIKAAKNDSEEAMKELEPLMYREDIKRAVAGIHLANNDLDALIDDYVNGLDDIVFLDRYCSNIPSKIVDVGEMIGQKNPERGIDWLRAHAFTMECRDALVSFSKDERYQCKKMVFALHDVGREKEAAELYFILEDSGDVPATKWLRKVCKDEEAKEFVRQHYESKDDLKTFDMIFEDDGYVRRPNPKGRGKKHRR